MSFDGRALERNSRYVLSSPIAEGGMATVHLGRLISDEGFARTVAVKRLHATYARDPHFVRMFLEEARVAARLQHPNVVDTLDVVAREGELFVVMDYIHGESLSGLLAACGQRKLTLPPRVAVGIVAGALRGLHAAHEAKNERGEKLELIHRDVSPQNVFVGADGYSRLIDFGIAKALGRLQSTREGEVKGKLSYMAPEQMMAQPIDRRADLFAAAIVLWEALAGRRLFFADDAVATMAMVMKGPIAPPSQFAQLPPGLDDVVRKGLERTTTDRYQTALEMVTALEAVVVPASAQEIAQVVHALASDVLSTRASLIRSLEDTTIPMTPTANHGPTLASPLRVETPTLEGSRPVPPRRWPLVAAVVSAALVAFSLGRLFGTQAPEPTPAPAIVVPSVALQPEPTPPTPPTQPVTPPVALSKVPPPPVPVKSPQRQRDRDCQNPFTVDSRGIKKPRPECFD